MIGGRNFINLWTYENSKGKKIDAHTLSSLGWFTAVRGILQTFMVVATVLFLIQNVNIRVSQIEKALWIQDHDYYIDHIQALGIG